MSADCSAVWVTLISGFQQWVLVCLLLHKPVFPDILCGCKGLYLPSPKQGIFLNLSVLLFPMLQGQTFCTW